MNLIYSTKISYQIRIPLRSDKSPYSCDRILVFLYKVLQLMLSVFVSLQSCIAWHSIYECHRCHATFNKKKKLRKTKYIFIIWITRLFTFCPDEMEIGAVRRGFELSKHGRRKYIKAYSKASSPVLRAYDSSRENVKTTNTRCVFLSLSLSLWKKCEMLFFVLRFAFCCYLNGVPVSLQFPFLEMCHLNDIDAKSEWFVWIEVFTNANIL